MGLWVVLIEFIKRQVGFFEGIRLTKCKFLELLGKGWEQGMKPQNIENKFLTTGIYPVAKAKFPVEEFNPSAYRIYYFAEIQSPGSEVPGEIPSSSHLKSPLTKTTDACSDDKIITLCHCKYFCRKT